jgi:hypothetical protein
MVTAGQKKNLLVLLLNLLLYFFLYELIRVRYLFLTFSYDNNWWAQQGIIAIIVVLLLWKFLKTSKKIKIILISLAVFVGFIITAINSMIEHDYSIGISVILP